MLSIRVSRRIEPAQFVKPESPPELRVYPNSPEGGWKQEYEFSLITVSSLTRVKSVVASNELRLYSVLVVLVASRVLITKSHTRVLRESSLTRVVSVPESESLKPRNNLTHHITIFCSFQRSDWILTPWLGPSGPSSRPQPVQCQFFKVFLR